MNAVTPALCKMCFYYNPAERTCIKSIVAVTPGKIHHDYAKFVRLDTKRCGPKGAWFQEVFGKDGLTPTSK